ncbi:hypothetical protein A6K26_005550 [Gammaproteobacteria bacterium 2W06]|nr:hypothetical protein A6K26_005550 [Gammaproteobacteria bacterium 2W06]
MKRILMVLIALLPTLATAAVIAPDDGRTRLDSQVAFLEDPTGGKTIAEVRAADAAGAFVSNDGIGGLNFGLSASVYWLRFTLVGNTPEPAPYLIEVGFYGLTDLRLFYPDGTVVETGQYQPAANRPWPHRHPVFPIQLASDAPQTYYLRVASVGSLTTPLTLWEPATFSYATQTDYLWTAAYYGVAGALLLFNFFLFLSLRDRNYLLYCGFLLFAASGMWFMNGFGAYSLALVDWPRSIGTNTLFSIAGVFAVEFLRQFLDTRRSVPGADWLLRGLMVAFTVVAAFPLLDLPVRIGVISLSALAVLAGPSMLAVTVICWLAGYRSARFLLAAWAVLLLAVGIQAARNFALVPTNAVTLNLMQIGSLLDMLLLSFALADRIQAERRAREQAQDIALEAEAELVQGLRDSERQLERKVQDRTEALESALNRERETLNQYIEFGALIAHEFRNPLAIISNQTELARLEQQRDHALSDERLQAIDRAAERLRGLFDEWLKSDRLHDRLDAMERQTINLDDWLARVLHSSDLRVTHSIVIESIDAVPVVVDEALLTTALHNLIDNAAKYSPAGAPIRVRTRRAVDCIGIAVSDEGAGIDEAEQAAIFRKHHQAAGRPRKQGLGLGLYLVAEVMRAHGGSVTVDSSPGRGSVFTLWIPLPSSQSLP